MKKIMKQAVAVLMTAIAVFAFNAKAADCSEAVTIFCQAIDDATAQIQASKNLNDLAKYDMFNNANFKNIPDECEKYELTAADKDKMKSSLNAMFDTMGNKFVEFGQGMITRQMIDGQLNPIREGMNKAIDDAKTLEDVGNNISKLQ